MSDFKCPGQDMRFWKPDAIFEAPCPHCGASIEFWKDEPSEKCRNCGQEVGNPRIDLGCAEWCTYADQCVGVQQLKDKTASVCDAVIQQMKLVFGEDQRRIQHAIDVLRCAETILDKEGGDPLVVKAAAVLHDIGIKEAEARYGSSAGKYQEISDGMALTI